MKVDAGLCLIVFLAQNFHMLRQFSAMLFHIGALSLWGEGPFDRLSFSRAVPDSLVGSTHFWAGTSDRRRWLGVN